MTILLRLYVGPTIIVLFPEKYEQIVDLLIMDNSIWLKRIRIEIETKEKT